MVCSPMAHTFVLYIIMRLLNLFVLFYLHDAIVSFRCVSLGFISLFSSDLVSSFSVALICRSDFIEVRPSSQIINFIAIFFTRNKSTHLELNFRGKSLSLSSVELRQMFNLTWFEYKNVKGMRNAILISMVRVFSPVSS